MPVPLIAAAITSGVLRAGVGALGAARAARRAKRAIKSAYRVGAQRLTTQQGDDRQASLEALNARGLVTGAAPGQVSPIAAAYTALPAGSAEAELRARALRGQTAAAGTLGGALDATQSGEFLEEQRQLYRQKRDALRGASAAARQGMVDSVGAGIDTALSVYSAGKTLGAMRGGAGASVTTPGASSAPSAPPSTIRGAFGIDPLDPTAALRDGSLSISQFTVGPRASR